MGEDLSSNTIFFLIGLVSILTIRLLFFKPRSQPRLPPSPVSLPIIGHLHLLVPIPHQALHKLSVRYGPLLGLRLGAVFCVVASSAEMAKEFLKTHEFSFADRPRSKAVTYLTYGGVDFSFAPYGPYWKFMKKLCMSELLGGRTLDQLAPVRREEVLRLLQRLQLKAKAQESLDVGGELIRLANNVICRMTMSRRCSETDGEAEEVRKLVEEMAELTGKFNLADYIGFCKNLDLQGFDKRLENVRRRFDEMIDGVWREKEAARREAAAGGGHGAAKDILDILFDIYEDENAPLKLTKENIKAFILDMFAAGSDTAGITMEWALSELINHPSMQRKLREEINNVVGSNRIVDESDIPNLPYLQAIVKETLRLHPTGPIIIRESTKDCEIGGYHIPAKTTLFVNVWAIGRDPKHWQDPLEFRPERFTEEDGGLMDVRGQRFHLLPFGSGRRGCPGTSLALQLIQSALAALVQCFHWEVHGGGGVVDMSEAPGLTLPRAQPLVCTPVARMVTLPGP